MDSGLERLLLDLKADRVSREYVKRYLRDRQGRGELPAGAPGAAPPTELLRCHPVWRAGDGPATGRKPGHMVLLAGPPELEPALLQQDETIDVRLLRSGATRDDDDLETRLAKIALGLRLIEAAVFRLGERPARRSDTKFLSFRAAVPNAVSLIS